MYSLNKTQKALLIGIASAITVGLIAKKYLLTPGVLHPGEVADLKNPLALKSPFPLKKGDKGEKVRELQLALGAGMLPQYGADGDFGAETESAVKKVLNKITVASQSEISAILQKREDAEFKSNGTKRADEILSQVKANPNLQVMLSKETLGQCYIADSYGAMKFYPAKNLMFRKDVIFNQSTLKPIGRTVSGYLQIKYRGDTYRVNALDVVLMDGPKIVSLPMPIYPTFSI